MSEESPHGSVERLVGRLRVAATKLDRSDEWENLRDDLHHAAAEIERLTAERDELRRQLAEAEMDAERYRWLREHVDGDRWYLYYDDCGRDLLQGDALDAAIDAARKPENEADVSRSARLAAAGFTRRDTRLQCDECGKFFSPQFLPIHKCDADN